MLTVSIVVPNYNHSNFLKQRLDSIFNQTYQNFEVILLDDCSTDNSVEILSEYTKHPKVSALIINEVNSGNTFKQWRKGIEMAQGEYIWIAESDDWASESFLESCIKSIERNKEIGLVTCISEIANESGQIIRNTTDWLSHLNDPDFFNQPKNGKEFILEYLLDCNYLPNASGVVFRKGSINMELEFDNMKQSGDRLFWIGILLNSDILYLNERLNYFRRHQNSVTEKNYKTNYSIPIINSLQIIDFVKANIDKSIPIIFWKAKKYEIIKLWINLKSNSSFNNEIFSEHDIQIIKYRLKNEYLLPIKYLNLLVRNKYIRATRYFKNLAKRVINECLK